MKKITATAVVGALCVALVACTPPESETAPKPSYTAVPTTSPTPVAGIDTPLATTTDDQIGYPVHISVYDVQAWPAKKGCDCSAPGDETTELYPEGSTVWAVRVELETRTDPFGEGVEIGDVVLSSSWGPGAPVPVTAAEGEKLAKDRDLGWGYESAQTPSLFPWGQTRSLLMAVYVPRGAVTLELEMDVPPIPSQHNPIPVSYGLDVELPQSVLDLMYANSNGD